MGYCGSDTLKTSQFLYFFIPFFKCILNRKKSKNNKIKTYLHISKQQTKIQLFFGGEEYINYKMSTHFLYRTLHKAYQIVATYFIECKKEYCLIKAVDD